MSVEKENAKNEQYIFQYGNGSFSEVITYRKHLIKNIQEHPAAKQSTEIQNFSSESVTSVKFDQFLEIAKANGYTVYKVEKL